MTNRRHTTQRQVILEELQKLTNHPSAQTLYGLVRERLPKISLGTVYRNLDFLTRAGVIQKLSTGDTEARFDWNPEPHCHICCVRCGRVDDVHDAPGDLLAVQVEEIRGFAVLSHQLQFAGICPDCRASGDRQSDPKIH